LQRHSIHGMMEEENTIRPHQEIRQLTLEEKKFLLAVERGDMAGTRRMLQKAQDTDYINVNCVDPLGRTALLMAIDNENLEMVELLINYNVDTKDALLHSISEEFVEAVEVLLDHENVTFQNEGNHVSNVLLIFGQASAKLFLELGECLGGNVDFYARHNTVDPGCPSG